MKISPDTRESILFLGGCLGMLVFGLVMPLLDLGFNPALFGAWAAVAGAGFFAGLDTSRKKNGNGNGQR